MATKIIRARGKPRHRSQLDWLAWQSATSGATLQYTASISRSHNLFSSVYIIHAAGCKLQFIQLNRKQRKHAIKSEQVSQIQ